MGDEPIAEWERAVVLREWLQRADLTDEERATGNAAYEELTGDAPPLSPDEIEYVLSGRFHEALKRVTRDREPTVIGSAFAP